MQANITWRGQHVEATWSALGAFACCAWDDERAQMRRGRRRLSDRGQQAIRHSAQRAGLLSESSTIRVERRIRPIEPDISSAVLLYDPYKKGR